MTTQQHPITPPPELVEQWANMIASGSGQAVFAVAAQWGADQELDACCEWVGASGISGKYGPRLRLARRPKPLTLKDRALQAWAAVEAGTDDQTAMAVIRRALEALDD